MIEDANDGLFEANAGAGVDAQADLRATPLKAPSSTSDPNGVATQDQSFSTYTRAYHHNALSCMSHTFNGYTSQALLPPRIISCL